MTIQVTYANDSDVTTHWYMENEVLQTLEDSGEAAENGGYTYRLTNKGPSGTTDIFSNEESSNEGTVGGTDSSVDGREGLEQATNATEEWFFIETLEPGQSGTTELYIGLEGESEVNDYMGTMGELRIAYAVETVEDETIVKHIPGKRVNTGDSTNLILSIAAFLGAILLLILAVLSYRKDRKDGEEA